MQLNLSKLRKFQSKACDIRPSGKCPSCKRDTEVSYQIAEQPSELRLDADGQVMESCGYYCTNCGWSNAGSRPAYDDE